MITRPRAVTEEAEALTRSRIFTAGDHRPRARVAGLGLALLLAACSSGGDDEAEGTTTTTAATEDEAVAWVREDLDPVTEAHVVDGTVLVLVAEGGGMQLVGLDPATGETRWSDEASPGYAPPGTSVGFSEIGDDGVAYLRPAGGDLLAELVLADAATGQQRWTSDPLEFIGPPGACDDGEDVCGLADIGAGTQLVRFLGEGVVRPEPFPTGARGLGTDLLELGTRDPEVLAGYADGEVRWRTPLAEVFGDGYSTDYGWMFATYEDGSVVGTVGQDVPLVLPVIVDEGRYVTAGIGAADGRPRWRDVGTSFTCHSRLVVLMGEGGTHEDAEGWRPWPVRCRTVGTVTFESLDADGVPEIERVVAEGFDPATGETTWSVELDPSILTDEDVDRRPPLAGEQGLVVPGLDGPVVLDVQDGTTEPLGDDDVLWCRTEATFEIDEAWISGEPEAEPITERRGGVLAEPCRADGSAVRGAPAAFPSSIAAPAGDVTVVSTPGGVVGYRSVTR